MSDAQLNELRTRAVGFLVAFDIARDAKVKARQLLRWVLTEQRLRRAIAALPDAHELMAIHRRSDAELLDEGRRALARFRDAYGRKGELSDSSRMEAARQATWLRREWSTRHSGPDLLEVLERTK